MELFKAHEQWKTRPADERFTSLTDMHKACTGYRQIAGEAHVPMSTLRVEAQDNELVLQGKANVPAKLTHWAMGQLSAKAGAPAAYLRELPATLAAQNLNHGLKTKADKADPSANLLFHANGSLMLRSVLSDQYTRIWNSDITERLMQFQAANPQWKNPLAYKTSAPATKGGWPTTTGEMEPAGLYASDHDMFAFLIDESKTLKGSPMGLNRGFFVWNSEVGASSFGVMTFLFDRVCGNNIVWGANNVSELRVRHVGNADARAFQNLAAEVRRYADSSASETEAQIVSAQRFELGATRSEALEKLTEIVNKRKIPDLTMTKLTQALEVAERREDRYGNPYSLWGAVSGLTEASQWKTHADERVKVDRAAGKLLKVAF